jgi:hypothetical protein
MTEVLNIIADVIRIVTFQRGCGPSGNGFATRARQPWEGKDQSRFRSAHYSAARPLGCAKDGCNTLNRRMILSETDSGFPGSCVCRVPNS